MHSKAFSFGESMHFATYNYTNKLAKTMNITGRVEYNNNEHITVINKYINARMDTHAYILEQTYHLQLHSNYNTMQWFIRKTGF